MKKPVILTLLILLLCSACSSSSAADYGPGTDTGNSSGDFIIAPQADDDESDPGTATPVEDTIQSDPVIDDQGSYVQNVDPAEFDVSRLHYEDFDEFYGQVMYEGLPDDRVHEPLGNANGVWKYNYKLRNDQSEGSLFDELGYVEMSVHNENDPPVSIILHPRFASDGFEIYEESDDVGYEPFGGGFDEDNNIKLTGNNCVLLLKEFYTYEGREYLLAELWLSEEMSATFMMMRGQE